MPLVSVPIEESELFFEYFKTVWEMESGDNWVFAYQRQSAIEIAGKHFDSNFGSACFLMLSRAHDIIYDREYA